jgi:hypothetical protein
LLWRKELNKLEKLSKMKRFRNIHITLAIMIFTGIAFSQANKEVSISGNKTEENYLSALNSGNEELKVSSAYMLGEIKSEKAVVLLMDMFRKEKDDGAKLVAALSLLKIGDARGVFLVKRSIELGEKNGITIILQHLYKDYSLRTKEFLD